jgi:hypothetical protein
LEADDIGLERVQDIIKGLQGVPPAFETVRDTKLPVSHRVRTGDIVVRFGHHSIPQSENVGI